MTILIVGTGSILKHEIFSDLLKIFNGIIFTRRRLKNSNEKSFKNLKIRDVAGFDPTFSNGGSSRAVLENLMHLRVCLVTGQIQRLKEFHRGFYRNVPVWNISHDRMILRNLGSSH